MSTFAINYSQFKSAHLFQKQAYCESNSVHR